MAETAWHDVAALTDIDEETGLAVRVDEEAIALFLVDGTVRAVEDFCPHQGSPLSGALTRDGIVTCPLHAWQFRLDDGTNVDDGPGLRTFSVRQRDGRIEIEV